MKPTWIAELGINAHGGPEKMLRMIQKAAASGASYIKGQFYEPVSVLGRSHPELKYAIRCQFSKPQHETFAKYAESLGSKYFVSVFNVTDVKWASQFGVMKIASRMNENQDFIAKVSATKLPTFMSVQPVIKIKKQYVKQFSLLWCVREYPTSKASILQYPYQGFGLSSHCPDPSASYEAYRLGAKVFENHLCESRDEKGCDISSSITFDEYSALINQCAS